MKNNKVLSFSIGRKIRLAYDELDFSGKFELEIENIHNSILMLDLKNWMSSKFPQWKDAQKLDDSSSQLDNEEFCLISGHSSNIKEDMHSIILQLLGFIQHQTYRDRQDILHCNFRVHTNLSIPDSKRVNRKMILSKRPQSIF